MEKDICYRIMNYQKLANHYMQLAYLMRNKHQFKTSLILCNLVLTSTARALYIYENKSNPYSQDIIFDDFLLLICKNLNIDPEIADLVHKIDLLCYSEEDFTLDRKIADMLIEKTADILNVVGWRLMNLIKST
ncbi:hypothetical protein [Paenibacillus senegalimassiliensis]|uniref:hypothetical protein n=1 Tax=Paenibacillus senegalimassiliensis TaxID=1737426 RepID=UPI00073F790F|nr:hypothetical protein [Paenibacillus senegalimassiliensis]